MEFLNSITSAISFLSVCDEESLIWKIKRKGEKIKGTRTQKSHMHFRFNFSYSLKKAVQKILPSHQESNCLKFSLICKDIHVAGMMTNSNKNKHVNQTRYLKEYYLDRDLDLCLRLAFLPDLWDFSTDRDRLCFDFLGFFSLLLPGDSELLLVLDSEPECFFLSLVELLLLSCLESCLNIFEDTESLRERVLSLSLFLFNLSSWLPALLSLSSFLCFSLRFSWSLSLSLFFFLSFSRLLLRSFFLSWILLSWLCLCLFPLTFLCWSSLLRLSRLPLRVEWLAGLSLEWLLLLCLSQFRSWEGLRFRLLSPLSTLLCLLDLRRSLTLPLLLLLSLLFLCE